MMRLPTTQQRDVMFVSNSKISNYVKCPRLFMYDYDNDRSGVSDSQAIQRGSVFHEGLEVALKAVHNGDTPTQAIAKGVAAMQEMVSDTHTLGATGIDMFKAYASYYVNDTLKPVHYAGAPLVEIELEVSYTDMLSSALLVNHIMPSDLSKMQYEAASSIPIMVSGMIDAILVDKTHIITMYDWKSRTYFTDDNDTQHDRQLWLYYMMLSTAYPQLSIDAIKQVQFSAKPPAEVRVNLDGSLSKRQGKLSANTVRAYLNDNEVSDKDRLILSNNTVEDNTFVHVYDLPLEGRKHTLALRRQLKSLHYWLMRMRADFIHNVYPAANNGYICSRCPSRTVCTH